MTFRIFKMMNKYYINSSSTKFIFEYKAQHNLSFVCFEEHTSTCVSNMKYTEHKHAARCHFQKFSKVPIMNISCTNFACSG